MLGSVDRKRKELADEDDLFGFTSTPSPVKRPRIQSNQQSAKKTIGNPPKPVENDANYREEEDKSLDESLNSTVNTSKTSTVASTKSPGNLSQC